MGRSGLVLGLVIGWTLACAGTEIIDETLVEAEAARAEGDYKEALELLEWKVEQEPKNSKAWRLMADVKLERGARKAKKRWRKNLVEARQDLRNAVTHNPKDCDAWARMAFVVAAAVEDGEARVDREWIEKLPLKEGWEACPSAAMLSLEEAREPTGEEIDKARAQLGKDAAEFLVLATVRLDLLAGYQTLKPELDKLEWKSVIKRRPKPESGGWFAVVDGFPVKAGSVGGSSPRNINQPFAAAISSASRKSITFLDLGFARRTPQTGWVRTSDCPGSKWSPTGMNNKPTGTCVAGTVRRGARVLNGSALKKASASHWSHPSIQGAVMNRAEVADARCVGGAVGRILGDVDSASCAVTYDKLIPQRRSVNTKDVVVAASEDHARRMADAANMQVFYGANVAKEVRDGKVAKGLPYPIARLALEDISRCKGREILMNIAFGEKGALMGPIGFECVVGDQLFVFEDMALARWGRAR